MSCLKTADLQCFHCILPDCVDGSRFCMRIMYLKERKESKALISNIKNNTVLKELPRPINYSKISLA